MLFSLVNKTPTAQMNSPSHSTIERSGPLSSVDYVAPNRMTNQASPPETSHTMPKSTPRQLKQGAVKIHNKFLRQQKEILKNQP